MSTRGYHSSRNTSSSSDDDRNNIEISIKGEILEKNYIPLKEINRGGHTIIWLTYVKNIKQIKKSNNLTSNFVVIKQYNNTNNAISEAEDEIESVNRLEKAKIPNVMYLLDYFKYKNYHCLVYPLMSCSLYDLIRHNHRVPIPAVKKITIQMLTTLNKLHKDMHILHCDIKPENVLVYGNSDCLEKMGIKSDINLLFKSKKTKNAINVVLKELDEKSKQSDDREIHSHDKNDKSIKYCNHSCVSNPKIMINDFGTCSRIDERYDNYACTSYYRAPEDILGYKWKNESVDTWALACTVYELISGRILFDPNKNDDNGRYSYHLRDIQRLIGPPTLEYLSECKHKISYYKIDGRLKGWSTYDYVSISQLLINNKINNEDIPDLADFLLSILKWDPRQRLNIDGLLNHKWLKSEYGDKIKES